MIFGRMQKKAADIAWSNIPLKLSASAGRHVPESFHSKRTTIAEKPAIATAISASV